MSTFTPTAEQTQAINLYNLGDSLVVTAGAGTGKSSTLVAMAEANPALRVQYTAFNKAIVTDIGAKLPRNAQANTAHSLAFRAVVAGNPDLKARLGSGRMRAGQVARELGIDPIVVTIDGVERKVLQPDFLASLAQRAVNVFCSTADEEPGKQHIPYIEGIDMPDDRDRRRYGNNDLVRAEIMQHVRAVWADVQRPNGKLKFEHGHYLKMWERSNPRIQCDVIMFDEAQDASPVMLSVVEQQRQYGVQVVFVGDAQQAIYEFTGAVDAISNAQADHRTALSQSFRFGPGIADVANLVLDQLDADLRLIGLPSIPSRLATLETPDAILTRTNSGAIETVLNLQRRGVKVHLVGGGDQIVSFVRAAQNLMDGRSTTHPELACFSTWEQVLAYTANDPQGDELRLMVRMIQEFTIPVILGALDNAVPEAAADVVVSTAHKAKGREWDRVQLHSDFPETVEDPGEWRLIYVAATRARLELDPWACAPLRQILSTPVEVG